MKNKAFVSVILLSSALMGCTASSPPSSIQGTIFKDRINGIYDATITDEEIDSFLNHLKKAVQKDNVSEFAKLVHYPCRWNVRGKTIYIQNSNDFKKQYDQIVTPSLQKLILHMQRSDLFVNSQGFMMGNGEIWFIPGKGIIAFNAI